MTYWTNICSKFTGLVTYFLHRGVNYDTPNPLKGIPELHELQLIDLVEISHVRATAVAMYSFEYKPLNKQKHFHSQLYACVLTLVDNRKYCIHMFPEDLNNLLKLQKSQLAAVDHKAATAADTNEEKTSSTCICQQDHDSNHKFPEDMNKLSVPEAVQPTAVCETTPTAAGSDKMETISISVSGAKRARFTVDNADFNELTLQPEPSQSEDPNLVAPAICASSEQLVLAASSETCDATQMCMKAEKEIRAGRVVVLEWKDEPTGWKLEKTKLINQSTLVEFVKICGDQVDLQTNWSKQAAERMMTLE